MRSSLLIGVGNWTMPPLLAEHSSAPQPVHQTLQAGVHLSIRLCRQSARLWQVPVLQAHPPRQSPESCCRQNNPPSNVSNQIQSLWFFHMNGYEAYGAQYKEPSAKLALNLTGSDLWLFVQGLKGSLGRKSLMQSSTAEPFPLHPSALGI